MATPAEHRDDLLRAFRIGSSDLEANHAGRLSDVQARQLRRSGYLNLLAALGVGVGLATILVFVSRRPLAPVQWIVSTLLFAGTLVVGIIHFRKTHAAAMDGRVECLTGPSQVQMRGKAGFYLNIAGRSFKLPVRPWHVGHEVSYRVYVAPMANQIVAMEPDA